MNQMDRDLLKEIIRESINGEFTAELSKRMSGVERKVDDFIKTNNEKWAEAQPVIDMGKNINGFAKTTKILIGVGVAIGSIWYAFEWISNFIKR